MRSCSSKNGNLACYYLKIASSIRRVLLLQSNYSMLRNGIKLQLLLTNISLTISETLKFQQRSAGSTDTLINLNKLFKLWCVTEYWNTCGHFRIVMKCRLWFCKDKNGVIYLIYVITKIQCIVALLCCLFAHINFLLRYTCYRIDICMSAKYICKYYTFISHAMNSRDWFRLFL